MNIEIESILAIFGFGGLIIIGISSWISKLIFSGIIESFKTSNQKQIEFLKSELSILKEISLRNTNSQFKLYTELWNTLQDLKSIGDRLWEHAPLNEVELFSKVLQAAQIAVNRGRLILSKEHYLKLMSIFKSFNNYRIGKKRLLEIRSEQEWKKSIRILSENNIHQQILSNRKNKKDYDNLLDEILMNFKKALGFM
jgi:hypothetical protein